MILTFAIPFTPHLSQLSLEIHEELMKFLKQQYPKAKSLSEVPELYQLYFAWILIRGGHLYAEEMESYEKNIIFIKAQDQNPFGEDEESLSPTEGELPLKSKKLDKSESTYEETLFFTDKRFGSLPWDTLHQLWPLIKKSNFSSHSGDGKESLQLSELLQLEDLLLLIRLGYLSVDRDLSAKENTIVLKIKNFFKE